MKTSKRLRVSGRERFVRDLPVDSAVFMDDLDAGASVGDLQTIYDIQIHKGPREALVISTPSIGRVRKLPSQ